MKPLFLIVQFLFCAGTILPQENNLRKLFLEATDSDGIQQFYRAANALDEKNMLLKAYKGTATAMYASEASSVTEKLRYFNKGKALLEEAVKNDPGNAEIRFLRFSVQSEAPFILGYSGRLKEDTQVIIEALEKNKVDLSAYFWKKAIRYLYNSSSISSDQQQRLNTFKTG